MMPLRLVVANLPDGGRGAPSSRRRRAGRSPQRAKGDAALKRMAHLLSKAPAAIDGA
jgi:hypothetical protein